LIFRIGTPRTEHGEHIDINFMKIEELISKATLPQKKGILISKKKKKLKYLLPSLFGGKRKKKPKQPRFRVCFFLSRLFFILCSHENNQIDF